MKQGIKKAVVGILAVSMVASVGAVSAFAAGTGRNFADADGNGVCDNYSVEQTVSRAAGALQKGSGQNFVDADNDGICDNYAVGQATGRLRQLRSKPDNRPGNGRCPKWTRLELC